MFSNLLLHSASWCMTGFLENERPLRLGVITGRGALLRPSLLPPLLCEVLLASACCHQQVNTTDAEGHLTSPDGLTSVQEKCNVHAMKPCAPDFTST